MHTFVQLLITLSSTVFWFNIDKVHIFNKPVYNAQLIHAVVSSVGNNAILLYQPLIITNYTIIYNDPKDLYIIMPLISFGYSFYDLYIGIQSKSFANIAHGLMFSIYMTGLFYTDLLPVSHMFMIIESSSIFLNLRPYKSKLNDYMFVITFFIFRFIISPVCLFIYISNPDNIYRGTALSGIVGITTINSYWFFLIIQKLKNSIVKKQIE